MTDLNAMFRPPTVKRSGAGRRRKGGGGGGGAIAGHISISKAAAGDLFVVHVRMRTYLNSM